MDCTSGQNALGRRYSGSSTADRARKGNELVSRGSIEARLHILYSYVRCLFSLITQSFVPYSTLIHLPHH